MNVLIATPTFGDGPCPETAASIAAQDATQGWEWRQYRNGPFPKPCMANVLAQYQHIRAEFLAGDWDALLTVEHDMVLPPHALQALWDAGKPVVYGVYLLRHGTRVLNAWEYTGGRTLGESLTLRQPGRRFDGLVRVSGVGFGCTLIRREIVSRFPFHGAGVTDRSPDVPFAEEMERNGIEQWAHFGVLCGHIDKGVMLMPYGPGDTCTVTALQSLNANVNGNSVPLAAGQSYTLPAGVAHELERAGYVQLPEPRKDTPDVPGSADTDDGHAPVAPAKKPRKPRKAD